MAKLDTIIENQTEQMNLLRNLASASAQSGSVELIEDILPKRMESVAEIEEFNNRLQNVEYRRKMVTVTVYKYSTHLMFYYWFYKECDLNKATAMQNSQNNLLEI